MQSSNITIANKWFEIVLGGQVIDAKDRIKCLGVYIDNSWKHHFHVSQVCKKASKKLYALAKISKFMNIHQRIALLKTPIMHQLSYCLLVSMFYSIYIEYIYYQNIVSIHQRNLPILAIEILKCKEYVAER